MTDFVSPHPAPPPAFHTCECTHKIYDHGRLGKDGNQVWVGCRSDDCGCTTYRASDGSPWPTNNAGAVLEDPTGLDVDTDHWQDGQVRLTEETA